MSRSKVKSTPTIKSTPTSTRKYRQRYVLLNPGDRIYEGDERLTLVDEEVWEWESVPEVLWGQRVWGLNGEGRTVVPEIIRRITKGVVFYPLTSVPWHHL